MDFDGADQELSEKVINELIQSAIEKDECINLINVSFKFHKIDGVENLKGISLENCNFRYGLHISNLTNGTHITMNGCSFHKTIGIALENIALRSIDILNTSVINIEEDWAHTEFLQAASNIVPDTIKFNNVVLHSMRIYVSPTNIEAMKLCLLDKMKLVDIGKKDELIDITFLECSINTAEIHLIRCFSKYIFFNNCNMVEVKGKANRGAVVIDSFLIKKFEVRDSLLPDTSFYFVNLPIKHVDICNSSIDRLNLLISSTSLDEEKTIHNLNIVQSKIGRSIFVGRIIGIPFDFRKSTFIGVPIFYGVEIPQGSMFPNKEKFLERKGDDSIKAYRALRLAMEMHRAREEEGKFFCLEQETILNTHYAKIKYITLNYWYKITSDYGTNYKKPLVFLFFTCLLFAILYALILSPVYGINYGINWELLEKTSVYSLKQIFLPFHSLRELSPLGIENSEPNLSLRIISVIQTLLGAFFISVSIIAIRWTFKRG